MIGTIVPPSFANVFRQGEHRQIREYCCGSQIRAPTLGNTRRHIVSVVGPSPDLAVGHSHAKTLARDVAPWVGDRYFAIPDPQRSRLARTLAPPLFANVFWRS
jgi:hypothetical protein